MVYMHQNAPLQDLMKPLPLVCVASINLINPFYHLTRWQKTLVFPFRSSLCYSSDYLMVACNTDLYFGDLLHWNLSYTAKKGEKKRIKTVPTSRTFCWFGSRMKVKVSFQAGLMLLSMCLVLFLLSGAVGMNSSTYGSGVSTADTLQS